MKKQPLLIDCDTGTDDAIAIVCALQNQENYNIVAITTVAGNVTLENTSKNTLNLVDMLGYTSIDVAKGADKPLKRELYCAISHGESGLGDVELPASSRSFHKDTAFDLIYQHAVASQGELIILATGPQTNLATVIQQHPDVKDYIKHVYIMGGSLIGGNMTQASEFNAYVDPEALKIVFDAGIPTTMVGLDVTLQLSMPTWVIEKIATIPTPEAAIVSSIIAYSLRYNKQVGYEEANLHDVAAFCSIVAPELFKLTPYYVEVETEGSWTRGMTVADFRGVCPDHEKNIICAEDVDVDGFWDWLLATLSKTTK